VLGVRGIPPLRQKQRRRKDWAPGTDERATCLRMASTTRFAHINNFVYDFQYEEQ